MRKEEDSQSPVSNVRVKALEFRRLHEDWCADTIVGRYYVEEVQWKWQARLFTTNCDAVTEQVITRGQGFEDAKQAAQADYEKRVLSALESPAPETR